MVFGQCTTGALFPTTTFIPQCNQSPQIFGTATTNQYSKVIVVAGYQYNFRSLLTTGLAATTDYITIATDVTTPAVLFSGSMGNSGIYWTATVSGTIRFYTHTSSVGCPTTALTRQRKVIMAPFQARIDITNSLCGSPGTGQYTITVGPNHGWNSTSIVPPLTTYNTNSAGSITTGAALPLSYNITYNGTSVNSGTGGSSNTNAEICPNCPASVTNGTSTWSGTSTLTTPFTGYTYLTTTSPYPAGTNIFNAPNVGPVGTYTSPATIVGYNIFNQSIAVMPSGSISSLAAYNVGCGAYTFYPIITAPPNLLFNQSGTTIYSCGSGSVTLSANGGTAPYTISWFNQASSTIVTSPAGNVISASGGNYTIPNLAAGTYTFTLTDANGCIKTIVLPVTVAALSTPVISNGGPTTFCQGGSVVLTASLSSSYLWSTEETTPSITVSTPGDYTVTVTDLDGCIPEASTATLVTVNALPTPTISAATPTTFCIGGSVVLTASADSLYLWSNGATTQAITATTAGLYTVQVTNANGCVATSNYTITVNNSSASTNIVTAFDSFTWLDGNTYTASNNTATYTTTNAEGCDSVITLNLTITPSSPTLALQVFLDGYFLLGSNPAAMSPARFNNLVASGSANPGANTDVDVITVELRSLSNLDVVAYSVSPILQTNGSAQCVFPAGALGGSFYIVVKHRAAIPLWSANPVTLSSSSAFSFANNSSNSYSDGSITPINTLVPSLFGIWLGELNDDGYLDGLDYPWFENDTYSSAYGGLYLLDGDFNGDSYVDASDYAVFDYNSPIGSYEQRPYAITTNVSIGQSYQGGIVAYILQPGDPGYDATMQHGLIAAPSDQSNLATWGCMHTEFSGADGTAIGTGNQNTLDIMNGCSTAGIAARICGDLVLGGYSDWYLPSLDELNKLYLNKVAIGVFADFYYWSSTEFNNGGAWRQNFGNGLQSGGDKFGSVNVRAVRAF